jgi:hypothetical protein
MKRSTYAAFALVLLIAAAAVADVSVEHPVAAPAYEAPPGYIYDASAASDGQGFLVAWIDYARNSASSYSRLQMYATRVSETGEVLDPLGIRIPAAMSDLSGLTAVHLGDSYLVCWTETNIVTSRVLGVRIGGDGALLDTTPRVFADPGSLVQGALASDGKHAVIVYNINPTQGPMTIVLDSNANMAGEPKPLTNPAGTSAETVMIASNGHGFLVIHSKGTTFRATTLDANGVTVSTAAAPTPPNGGRYSLLASDGDTYVAILLSQAGARSAMHSQHLGPKGEAMGTWSLPAADYIRGLVFSGGSYLALDRPRLDPIVDAGAPLGLHRIASTGQPTGQFTPLTGAFHFYDEGPLASNGSSVLACWAPSASRRTFMGSVIETPSLTFSSPTLMNVAATTQAAPATATSGTNMAVVWNEADSVYAGRLTLDGQLLDGRGIRIGGRNGTRPSIVFDGTNYVIAWTETSRLPYSIRMARLSVSGVLLDPEGVAVKQLTCNVPGGLTLARGAHATLVVLTDCQRLVAIAVTDDLTPGTQANVVTVPLTRGIAAAWNGSEWLLAWETASYYDIEQPPLVEINAARLSPQLTLLDSKPIDVSNTYGDSNPLVASDGDGFLVAWSHFSDDFGEAVFARRIASDGSSPTPSTGAFLGAGIARSLAWDGLQYEVAFSTTHDMSTLYVTHVASHGSIESLSPSAVVNDRSVPDASLLVTSPGRVTVAYTRIDSRPEYGDVERAFVSVPHLPRGRAVR